MSKATQFIQDGRVLDYLNPTTNAIQYLDIIAGTGRLFIAAETIMPQEMGSVFAEGVFELPKASEAFTFGQAVYYNATNRNITGTAAGNLLAGYATAPVAANVATAHIKINA